jgi:signal transduction histidine kinase
MIWAFAGAAGIAVFFAARFVLLRREIRRVRAQIEDLCENARYGGRLYLEENDKTLAETIQAVNRLVDGYEDKRRQVEEMERNIRFSVSGISHDLRTPLTSIAGYLQLLSKESLTDRQRQYLDFVFHATDTLRELTENFYELSCLDMGEYVPSLQTVNLECAVCDGFLGFYENFEQKGLELVIQKAETRMLVSADVLALTRILNNIIQNLLRYAKGTITVSFSANADEETCAVTIGNESVAPLPEDAERIFERYYTADASRSGNSSGVGLYISRKLAESMGGRLTAHRQDDRLRMTLVLRKRQSAKEIASESVRRHVARPDA